MSTLKQVLAAFEDTAHPLTIPQIAHKLDLDPGVLDDMLAFWVRKGKLRDLSQCADSCTACGFENGCPLVMQMPRRYELVMSDELKMKRHTGEEDTKEKGSIR